MKKKVKTSFASSATTGGARKHAWTKITPGPIIIVTQYVQVEVLDFGLISMAGTLLWLVFFFNKRRAIC